MLGDIDDFGTHWGYRHKKDAATNVSIQEARTHYQTRNAAETVRICRILVQWIGNCFSDAWGIRPERSFWIAVME
jgi:hypothetical protein